MAGIRSNPLNAYNQSQTISDSIQNIGQIFSPVSTMQMGLLQAKQKEIEANIANQNRELDLKAPVYGSQAAKNYAEANKVGTENKILLGHQEDLRSSGGAISRLYNIPAQQGEDVATLSRSSGNGISGNAQFVPNVQNTVAGGMIVRNANDPATVAAAQNLRGNPMKLNEVAGPGQLADVMSAQRDNKIAEEQAKNRNAGFKPGQIAQQGHDMNEIDTTLNGLVGIGVDPVSKKPTGPAFDPAQKAALENRAYEYIQAGKAPNAQQGLAMAMSELFGSSDPKVALPSQNKGFWSFLGGGTPTITPNRTIVPGSLPSLFTGGSVPQGAPQQVAPVQAAPVQAAPSAPAPQANNNAAAILAQARQAIAAGKDPNAVKARLRQMGVDDSGL